MKPEIMYFFVAPLASYQTTKNSMEAEGADPELGLVIPLLDLT